MILSNISYYSRWWVDVRNLKAFARARLLAPPSSKQDTSPTTSNLSPGDNVQDGPHRATIVKRFGALALLGRYQACIPTTAVETTADTLGVVGVELLLLKDSETTLAL